MPAKLTEAESLARAEARAEARRVAVEQRKEAKRREREARSAANKAAWASDPRNVNHTRAEAKATVIAVPLDPEPEPGRGDNRALDRLRAIMGNPDHPLYRRIEAAEAVLQYELAPAALASGSAEPVAATALRFLRAIVDLADTPESLRFRALRCIAAIENARAARVDGDQLAGKRDLLLARVNSERRRVLIEAGCWPAADGWALSPGDDVPWPEGWPGSWAWPPPDSGVRLDAAKLHPRSEAAREAWRALLRSVRARNRVDDWDRDILASAA